MDLKLGKMQNQKTNSEYHEGQRREQSYREYLAIEKVENGSVRGQG